MVGVSGGGSPAASMWNTLKTGPLRVFVIGGGNWGTVVGRIAAQNARTSYIFHDHVKFWINEETFEGRPLTAVINERRENVKYLPGMKLPENLAATPDLEKFARGADLLIFVLPHQFMARTCERLRGNVKPTARAISLVKGLAIDNGRPLLFSELVERSINVACSALSGANVANDIAKEHFSETTLGFQPRDTDVASIWRQLLETPYFRVNAVPDIAGVQLCGAVKNVIAVAAGFCDGLGFGTNTKAAVIRLGFEEMRRFARRFFDNILEETFFDSCGYADVITTCFGGRNVRCAKEFALRYPNASWEAIEEELLNGGKLQGPLTAKDVHEILVASKLADSGDFPLFEILYKICYEKLDPKKMLDFVASGEDGARPAEGGKSPWTSESDS